MRLYYNLQINKNEIKFMVYIKERKINTYIPFKEKKLKFQNSRNWKTR